MSSSIAIAETNSAKLTDSFAASCRAPTVVPGACDGWRIVGSSSELRTVFADLECVAPTTVPVLITGETGTGKDLLARRVHERSDRSDGPWVHVDCTTLTAGLLESELYGHVRGAFTGAAGPRCGRVELAHGGTLFLDEIGELPLEQQCKLLRLIQHHEFEPVGSSRTMKVDVRIVAATNRDLPAEILAGRFRADLYYRLAGFPLSLPPLRDRLSDLPALIEYWLRRLLAQMGRPFEMPAASVISALQRHNWPGNIRELRAVLERACIRSAGRRLVSSDFVVMPAPAAAHSADSVDMRGPRARTLREVECEHLQAMLELSGGIIEGRNGAAAVLGLSPSTLRFRLRRLGILADEYRRPHADAAARTDTYTYTDSEARPPRKG